MGLGIISNGVTTAYPVFLMIKAVNYFVVHQLTESENITTGEITIVSILAVIYCGFLLIFSL